MDNLCPALMLGRITKTVVVGKSATAFIRGVIGETMLRQRFLQAISLSWKSFAGRNVLNRTDNRHRWSGRVDQGEREKVVQGTRQNSWA
jgi:hypothetical protein